MCYVISYWYLISFVKVVKSDQGGSRNMFSVKMQMQIHPFMLLLSLMIVNISMHTKVQTTKVTNPDWIRSLKWQGWQRYTPHIFSRQYIFYSFTPVSLKIKLWPTFYWKINQSAPEELPEIWPLETVFYRRINRVGMNTLDPSSYLQLIVKLGRNG